MFWPIEVQAGMDINVLQSRYHGRAIWLGGIHKHCLTGGERAIREELLRIKPALAHGGYIPACDHNVPMDVSFENYLIYLRLRWEILGLGDCPINLSQVRV
jgi:uroporphyrinogen decarboxylase